MAQVVEHVLGKDEVTSSNLVNSSKIPLSFRMAGFFFCCTKMPALPSPGRQAVFKGYPKNPRSSSQSAASSAHFAVWGTSSTSYFPSYSP